MDQEISKLKERYKYLLKTVLELEDQMDILTQQNYELSKRVDRLK